MIDQWIVYSIIALLCVCTFAWWRFRIDYHIFQRKYAIKLPFLCHVTYARHKDAVYWGTTRYRFITKQGKKDRRRSMNFRWVYPTKIYIQHFYLKIWRLEEARAVFRYLEPYMDLALDDLPFYGQIDGDLYVYFRGQQILFIRYCLKLLSFYGWWVELSGYEGCHGMAKLGNKLYAIHCILRRTPVVINDLMHLPKIVDGAQWIVITSYKVSNGAREYAREKRILLMDRECIRKTFVYEEPQFL